MISAEENRDKYTICCDIFEQPITTYCIFYTYAIEFFTKFVYQFCDVRRI